MSNLPGIHLQQVNSHGETAFDLINVDNAFCQAQIACQGAQVLYYRQKNPQLKSRTELLWLSEKNQFNGQKAIRGGIPLCFPWFGAHPQQKSYPAHGFARNLIWHLQQITFDEQTGHTLQFILKDDAYTRQYWDYAFELQMTIFCGTTLEIALEVKNLDQKPFDFTFAWHSYFSITHIQNIQISGFEHTQFIDQLLPETKFFQENHVINISQETDRIYPVACGQYQILDQDTVITIDSLQAKSSVVWNPWIEKTKRLNDVAEDAWQKFVCVECGQIGQPIILPVGQSQTFYLTLTRKNHQ
ncbi:D-hexose-6-phosphate mutarotase [Acinetobacter qingfengensis]|uniref:Putative glucose-6-phosphate 1-epimerase n=1 Tax=Acinetobacter qingfengensis TaxID=1262585 RepID=A0A1E7RFK8_9GAMM|nr:D-hexose-6-phosphate mutarotase [Acinetobacter qingfengensis]OEY98154.1 hypothetical protein BJI46_01140 [Acinetobacter qingfengensis]